MICKECTNCWFRYIEKCDGQEVNYNETVCKKKIIDKSENKEKLGEKLEKDI